MRTTPPRCRGHRRDGAQCTNAPIRGAEVCRMHGGSAPQVRAAAADRELDDRVARLIGQLEVAPRDNPLEALSYLAGEVVAWKDALGKLVAELTDIRYAAGASGEQIRGEVLLFERAMDRCIKVLGAIARLDLDNRLARITAQQAEVVVGAIEAAITAAGVTGTAAADARAVAARHLRVVAGVSEVSGG